MAEPPHPNADPFLPGQVAWSGDNPSLVLREPGAADYSVMVSLFRVMVSPQGPGVAAVLLQPTLADAGRAWCLTDNEALARHLVADYLWHFGLFAGRPALQTLRYLPLSGREIRNDLPHRYAETLHTDLPGAGPQTLDLRWQDLGAPYMIAMPQQGSPTGRHALYSTFMIARKAEVWLNGQRLPGQVAPRQQAGRPITSAFLAFSETWLRP